MNTHYDTAPLDRAVSNPYVRDMTRWCPVCESPGIPVAQGTGSIDGQQLLAVSTEDRIDHLETIGVEPVLFPPLSVHA